MDGNSSLPSWMSEHLGEAGQQYVKKQRFSNYQLSKNLSLALGGDDDDTAITLTKQHWYFERPILKLLINNPPRIDYPDAFDDILWEYAQGECDAAEKDVLAYATWYSSKKEYKSEVVISIPPSVTIADNTPPPSSTISAEKAGEFKKRLLQTLKGQEFEQLLSKDVNNIMNRTRSASRKVGKARAKTNPIVEQVMRNVDIDAKVPD